VRKFGRLEAGCVLTCLLFFSACMSLAAAAPSAKSSPESSEPAVEDQAKSHADADPDTRTLRGKSKITVLGSYSSVDLLLPGKKGVSIGYNRSADSTWEFEYLKAEIAVPFLVRDLGSLKEERISLFSRSYWNTNSFSGYLGLSLNRVEISVGDKLLNKLTGGAYPSLDLLEVDTLGFTMGIGNRWTVWRGVTIGADWIGWSQPIFVLKRESKILDYASNEEEKKNTERALDTVA